MKRSGMITLILFLLASACNSGQLEPTTATVTANATATETALEAVEPTETTVPPTEPIEPAVTTTDPVIIFKRTGGFAGLEDQWIIYADGRVEDGAATAESLSPDQIAQILADAEAGGFFDLKDQYIDQNHCCDFFNYEVTLNLADGRSHTVATVEQTPGMPPVLAQLIQELNELLVSGGIQE
jgi:hypothetical protein